MAIDNATAAACMLIETLGIPSLASPFISLGTDQLRSIQKLYELIAYTIPSQKADKAHIQIPSKPSLPPMMQNINILSASQKMQRQNQQAILPTLIEALNVVSPTPSPRVKRQK